GRASREQGVGLGGTAVGRQGTEVGVGTRREIRPAGAVLHQIDAGGVEGASVTAIPAWVIGQDSIGQVEGTGAVEDAAAGARAVAGEGAVRDGEGADVDGDGAAVDARAVAGEGTVRDGDGGSFGTVVHVDAA